MPISNGAGGGRNNPRLGSPHNIFGATSGSEEIGDVTIAPDINTANSVRDAYASSNPDWLVEYSAAGSNIHILLYFQQGGQGAVQYQYYAGGVWVNQGVPVIPLRGLPGDAATVANLADGHIPVKSSTSEELIDSGMTVSALGDFETLRGIRSQGSIESDISKMSLGGTHDMLAGGENFVFTNNASNAIYHPVWQPSGEGQDNRASQRIVDTEVITSDIYPAGMVEHTNPVVTLTTLPVANRLYRISGSSKADYAGVMFTIYKMVGNTEVIYGRIADIVLETGENDITLVPFLDLPASTPVRIYITSTEGDVILMGGADEPQLGITYSTYHQETLEKQRAVSKLVPVSGDYTATAEDFAETNHTVFECNNNGQDDLNLPLALIPDGSLILVKEIGIGGPTHRVLIHAVGGTIDTEFDYLLDAEESLSLQKIGNRLHIISGFTTGGVGNNYVSGISNTQGTISLTRTGLSPLSTNLNLIDIDNSSDDIGFNESVTLFAEDTTQQVAVLGDLGASLVITEGKLQLTYSANVINYNGYPSELLALRLTFGSTIMDFPIVETENLVTTTIEVSSALAGLTSGVEPSVSLVANVRGVSATTRVRIDSLENTRLSIIHPQVSTEITEAVALVKADSATQIANLNSSVNTLQSELQTIRNQVMSQSLGIPSDVLTWLRESISINPVTLTEEVPTTFNTMLGQGNPAILKGSLATTSGAVSAATVPLQIAGILSEGNITAAGHTLISTQQDGVYIGRYVEATPEGSHTETVLPSPMNTIPKEWYALPLEIGLHAEADSLVFSYDLPSTPTTVNFKYRWTANGGSGGTETVALPLVGGGTRQSETRRLALPTGESVDIEFSWETDSHLLFVRATPNPQHNDDFIFDLEIGANYLRTSTTAAEPEQFTTRRIGANAGASYFFLKPSSPHVPNDEVTLSIVTEFGEFDTNYLIKDLFGAIDAGELTSTTSLQWYFWRFFIPTVQSIAIMNSRIGLEQDGWYEQSTNASTAVDVNTKFATNDTSYGGGYISNSSLSLTAKTATNLLIDLMPYSTNRNFSWVGATKQFVYTGEAGSVVKGTLHASIETSVGTTVTLSVTKNGINIPGSSVPRVTQDDKDIGVISLGIFTDILPNDTLGVDIETEDASTALIHSAQLVL